MPIVADAIWISLVSLAFVKKVTWNSSAPALSGSRYTCASAPPGSWIEYSVGRPLKRVTVTIGAGVIVVSCRCTSVELLTVLDDRSDLPDAGDREVAAARRVGAVGLTLQRQRRFAELRAQRLRELELHRARVHDRTGVVVGDAQREVVESRRSRRHRETNLDGRCEVAAVDDELSSPARCVAIAVDATGGATFTSAAATRTTAAPMTTSVDPTLRSPRSTDAAAWNIAESIDGAEDGEHHEQRYLDQHQDAERGAEELTDRADLDDRTEGSGERDHDDRDSRGRRESPHGATLDVRRLTAHRDQQHQQPTDPHATRDDVRPLDDEVRRHRRLRAGMTGGDVDPHRGGSSQSGDGDAGSCSVAAPNERERRSEPVTSSAAIRSAVVVPSDVENSAPKPTPAASRCGLDDTGDAQRGHDPRDASARVANRGTSRSATRHVDAIPTIAISPMKNSHRADDRENGDGGGDTTALLACALALAADTPTPNAYAPVARWPSVSDTVFHVTV